MAGKSGAKKASAQTAVSSANDKAAKPIDTHRIVCDTCGKTKFKRSYRKLNLRKPPVYSATCLSCEAESGRIPTDPIEYNRQSTKRPHRLIQEERVRRELAHRELCRRRLIPYVKRHESTYQVGWLHDKIARELERFLDDVIAGKSPRLMFFVPPRHGKSMLVSDYFISWAVGKYPWLEIISSSYSSSLPVKFSRRIRARLMSKKHKAVFPEAELSRDSRNVEHWTTTKGGGYLAAGVGGGITGHGAHIFSIDDPIKDAEEADSETIREGHWDWWSSTASTRVAPGGGVIVTQTRWHDDDLSGRMLRNVTEMRDEGVPEEEIEEWRVIAFPAIAEDDEYELENGEIFVGSLAEASWEQQQKAKKLRAKGEALHEARWPLSYLKKKRRAMQPRHWSALFQQNPVPDEGITFTKDMFLVKPPSMRSNDEMILLAAWDLAIGKRSHHDYTVGVLGGLDYHGDLILLDCIRGRWGTFGIVEAILNMYARHPTIQRIGIERGQLELAIGDSLKARMEERRLYPRLDRTLVPIQDKEKRAAPLQGLMQHHKVFFPPPGENPWVLRAQDELLRFPAGVHEDIVDAMAWLARMAQKTSPPRPPKPARITSWKDRLAKHIPTGSMRDPMAA